MTVEISQYMWPKEQCPAIINSNVMRLIAIRAYN